MVAYFHVFVDNNKKSYCKFIDIYFFFSMMEFFDFSKIDIEREELNPFQLSEDEMGH